MRWRSWGYGRRLRRCVREWRCFGRYWIRGRLGTILGCCCGGRSGGRGRGGRGGGVERGEVVARPGSITPHTRFKGSVYVLTKEEGGRHTPFFHGYRPQFYFRTTDVRGVGTLPAGVGMV